MKSLQQIILKSKNRWVFFAIGLVCVHFLAFKANASGGACTETFKDLEVKTPKIKVAAVQFEIQENRTPAEFMKIIEDQIIEAKNEGSDLIVFPELHILDLISTSYTGPYVQQLIDIATHFSPGYIKKISELAKQHNISILGGTVPTIDGKLESGKPRVYNTAVFALPSGEIHTQNKMFLTPGEVEWNWSGSSQLKPFQTPWGKTVILICYDSEFPQITNLLAKVKPELILVPSMTDNRSGLHRVQWSSQARAVEHYAYVVHTGTSQGERSSEPYFAQASIITPQDPHFPTTVIRGRENANQIIYGDLDFDYLRDRRQIARIYPARDQTGPQKHTIRATKSK